MGTRQRKAFPDSYRAVFLSLIVFLFVHIGYGQTFQPGQHIVINDALGPANATPTDSRSMFYDVNFFLYRDYNGPTEVLTYLNLSKYRTGGFPIMVHSGGSLSGGVWVGGTRLVYWFKNGTADSNLVRWYTDSSSASCSGCLLAPNNLNDVANVNTARANLGLGTISTQSATASGGDLSGTWPSPTVSRFNGQLPSYYLNYLNLTNTPAIPSQLNPTGLGLTSITGVYPNLTWNTRTPGLQETITSNNATSKTDSINIGAFLFRFFGTSALGIPSGTTAQRPASPASGDTRWNTDSLALESWNGSAWVHPTGGGGGGGGITALTGDGTASGTGTVPFTLATVNSNVFGSNTFLRFGVNGKGLVTSATAVGSGDIISALGFTPYNATNPSGYISLSSLSASLPIVYNSGTGNISLSTPNTANKYLNGYGSFVTMNTDSITEGATNLFFTNARARAALSLTTTGTTGAATYNSSTGVFNVPQYQGQLTLTTTGTSGAATLIGNTLNIPNYAPGTGTVTSVALSTPSFLTTSGSPITTSGTFTVTLANQAANTVFGNHTGSSAAPTFGKVVLADQATNTANYIQGWDGSGNPTALAPDTLFVVNRVSGTGVQVGNISNDTLYLNNLNGSTFITQTKNSDSSITTKIANSTANTLLGWNGSGVPTNITAGTNITISGGVISSSGGSSTTLNFKGIAFGSVSNAVISDTTKLKFDSSASGHTYLNVNAAVAATGDIIGFGNSITFGLNANPQTTNNWLYRLAYILSSTPNNQGLSSSTLEKQTPLNPFGAANAVDRVAASIPAASSSHRLIIISYGINDVRYNGANYTTTNFVSDYNNVISQILAKGYTASQIILTSTPYVDSASAFVSFSGNPIATYARQASFDSCVQVVANTNGLKYIDIRTPMIALGGKILLSSDGLHPSNLGHAVIASIISKAIDSLRIGGTERLVVNGVAKFNNLNLQGIQYLNASTNTQILGIDSTGGIGPVQDGNFFGKILGGGALAGSDTANIITTGGMKSIALKISGTDGYLPTPTSGSSLFISRYPAAQNYLIAGRADWNSGTAANLSLWGYGGQVAIGGVGFTTDGTKLYVPTTGINAGALFVTAFNQPTTGQGLFFGFNGTNAYAYPRDMSAGTTYPFIIGQGNSTASSAVMIGGTSDDGTNGFQVYRPKSRFYGQVGININAVTTANLKISAGTTVAAPFVVDTTSNSLTNTPIPWALEMKQDSLFWTGYSGTRYKIYPQSGTNIYNSDGTLAANRTLSGGGFSLTFGTSGSKLSNLSIWSTQGLNLTGGQYNNSAGSQLLEVASTINNPVTTASGNVTNFSAYDFGIPTITSTNTSITYSHPATLRIEGSPIMSTNSTNSNQTYAFDVVAGISHFGVGGGVSAWMDGTVSIGAAPNNNLLLSVGASTSSMVPLYITPGVDPTGSLLTQSGDAWYNGTNLYFVDGSGTGVKRDILTGINNYRHTIFTPTSGGTVTAVALQENIINPAGTLATLTIALPASPNNNDVINFTTTQSLTAITYTGGTVVGPTTRSPGQWHLVFDSGTSTWY